MRKARSRMGHRRPTCKTPGCRNKVKVFIRRKTKVVGPKVLPDHDLCEKCLRAIDDARRARRMAGKDGKR